MSNGDTPPAKRERCVSGPKNIIAHTSPLATRRAQTSSPDGNCLNTASDRIVAIGLSSERSSQSEELGGSEMVDGVGSDGLQRYFPIISKHVRCSPFARRPRSTSGR